MEHPSVLSDGNDGDEFQALDKLDGLPKRHGRLNPDHSIFESQNSSSKEQVTAWRGSRHAHRRPHGQFDGATSVANLVQAVPPTGGARSLCRHVCCGLRMGGVRCTASIPNGI